MSLEKAISELAEAIKYHGDKMVEARTANQVTYSGDGNADMMSADQAEAIRKKKEAAEAEAKKRAEAAEAEKKAEAKKKADAKKKAEADAKKKAEEEAAAEEEADTEAVEEEAEEEAEVETEKEDSITEAKLKEKIKGLIKLTGSTKAPVAFLRSNGYERMSDVDEEDYATLYDKVTALLKKSKAAAKKQLEL